jgi:protoporphyrinogen oxidase
VSAAPGGPPVVVLGGGPAGLALAFRLAGAGWTDVTVLERARHVGGNAGSFVIDGIPVDFGSHRLHPSCPPQVLADLRALLGGDLLERPRHGRIRLRGRWVHFPLKPLDLVRRLPPSFAAGVLADAVTRPAARARTGAGATFATVLGQSLGRTICEEFYFPYVQKIWGVPPDALDPELAKRRVSGGTIWGLVKRVAGLRSATGSRAPAFFFYPRRGYGQISETLATASAEAGATIRLGAEVTGVVVQNGRVDAVSARVDGTERSFPGRFVLSTIPLTVLARLVRPSGGAPIEAAAALAYRAMVLVYLTLDADRFTEYDAHYFPESAVRISRLSEPKYYSVTVRPGRTVLCAELPCAQQDAVWSMNDRSLGDLVRRDLEDVGLGPLPAVLSVESRRLPQAYPIYTSGYRHAFDAIDRWIAGIDGLVTFGRQGLFAHDNTHHAMAMAYALADCLSMDGVFDTAAWAAARQSFESHVVED